MSKKQDPHAAPPKDDGPREAARAYDAIFKDILALSEKDIRPINVDVPRAVTVVIGALPRLRALRPAIVAELPRHPVAALDRLEDYALGAWYAHLLDVPSPGDTSAVTRLTAEGAPLRVDLLVAAEALAQRGLLDPAAVARIRSGQGTLDQANDLVALAALFTRHWPAVHDRTAVEQPEIQRAARLGAELLAALGQREQGPVTEGDTPDPAQCRTRAFTLMANAYEECQRAVAYLRWHHDDADEIAPTIFNNRTSGRRTTPDEPTPPPAGEPGSPATPA